MLESLLFVYCLVEARSLCLLTMAMIETTTIPNEYHFKSYTSFDRNTI